MRAITTRSLGIHAEEVHALVTVIALVALVAMSPDAPGGER